MKIEAVIVCINYSDFLAATLPSNKKLFNKIIVVTDLKDTKTVAVCVENGVSCVQTNSFYKDGEVANKAMGINEGLKKLDKDGWVVQLDADIWLPPLTRDILEKYPLNGSCIYGIDRYMCNSYPEWQEFISNEDKKIHDAWIFLHMHHFEVGTRVVQFHGEGYMPIGFFQLWNPSISGIATYPVEICGYDRTDVVHLKQFSREDRRFIPDFLCVHISSEEPFWGQNWHGRKSKEFSHEEHHKHREHNNHKHHDKHKKHHKHYSGLENE